MRVIVDCLAARSGGIATYADGLLGAWSAVAPDDHIHALVQHGDLRALDGGSVQAHTVRVPSPTDLFRPLAGTLAIARLAHAIKAEIVLTTNPVTPLWDIGIPLAIVVHDLRDELRPEQFSQRQHMLRQLSYRRGYRKASGIVCVSARTRKDLLSLHPDVASSVVRVVHHGVDHVHGWPQDGQKRGGAVAFAHQSNKRTKMAIDAWALLTSLPALPVLKIVGVDPRQAEQLSVLIDDRDLNDQVTLSPFLPAGEFERLLIGADLVVFPSDFEGFGLPALEAMALGIPVVVAPDPAVAEVTAGYATTMAEWSAASLAEAVGRALAQSTRSLKAAQQHSKKFTWARTAQGTRDLLEEVLSLANSPGAPNAS